MRTLLLAAGLGTRLAPLTNTIPKCLVPIAGRPLLDYWLELLSAGGVRDILINLHYLPETVKAYIAGSSYPVNITLAYEQRLLGTGGTVLKNRAFFKGGPLLLAHADNFSFFDLRAFIDRFESRDSTIAMTMMTYCTDTPQSCGIVELDDKGVVRAFYEKQKNPPGNLANAAVYILAPEIVEFIAALGKEEVDFSTEVLPRFMGRINTYTNDIYHRDIGTPESLVIANQDYPAIAEKLRARSSRKH